MKPRPPDKMTRALGLPTAPRHPASVAMYPSLAELLATNRVNLPPEVIEAVRARYDAHGWEYVAPRALFGREDRRPVNMCMISDSVELAREELLDAIWNLLVAQLKEASDWRPTSALYHIRAALHLLSLPHPPIQRKASGNGWPRDIESGIAKSS